MNRRSFVPRRPNQVRIARKAKAHDDEREKCPCCQEKLRVSQPGDALEHEADRAADAVMSRTPPPSLNTAPGAFQRDPKDKHAAPPADDSHSLSTGLGKVAEAASKTPAGKKALKALGKEAKKVASNPAADVALGAIAGGAVAGMAATNQKLPFQLPAVPLGDTDLNLGLRYEGPLRHPSYMGLTLSGVLPGEPKSREESDPDPAAYRAETARIRAELERWKLKQHAPGIVPGALAPLAHPPAAAHAPAPPPPPPRKKEVTPVKTEPAPVVHRKARSGNFDGVETAWDVMDESGEALDPATQHFMEQRFGRDFSAVRVHAGARGAHAADAIQARAFTYGEHVAFASGEYHPGTESGRHLLAHELAHVAQQGAAPEQSRASAVPMRALDFASPVLSLSSTPPGTVARASKPPPKDAVTIDLGSAGELNGLKFKVWPEESDDGSVKGLKAFHVDKLTLPASKGANALAVYERYARGDALSSTVQVDGNPKAAMWQGRASTNQLQRRWLDMRGWPTGAAADKYWKCAGGDGTFPRLNNHTCEMDHIIELQLGGNNTNENIQALDADKNQASGRTLWAELSGLAKAINTNKELDAAGAKQIRMQFAKAVMQGKPARLTKTCHGKQPSCLAVETCASKVKLDDADIRTGGTESYPLVTDGGHQTTVNVPLHFPSTAKAGPVSFSTPENQAAATLIPGLLLETLHHAPGTVKRDYVDATIDTQTKTRLPLSFNTVTGGKGGKRGKGLPAPVKLEVRGPKNTLKFAENHVRIPFEYRYLSKGEITRLSLLPDGIDFAGSITPSIPFLGKLDIAYEKGTLSVTKGLDPKKIRLPLPGAKITRFDLGLELAPTLKATGGLAFDYAPGGKKLLDATLTASADTEGLKAAGDIHAYLPGVDNVQGHLEYAKSSGWSGFAKASADDLKKKFKYVSSGEVSIGLKDNKRGGMAVDAQGSVMLDLPHTKGVTATLRRTGAGWSFHGRGTFEVPRLKPVDITINYDGTHLSGEAKNIGFKYRGFDASIDINYWDGKFSGSGTVEFEKGRAKGRLNLKLLRNERFTGSGSVTLQIRDGVEATAGVELDEHEKLHVSGKLAFPKPIKLFNAFGGDATIFKAGISIPIPGASIGPVGIKARIEGALEAGYQIGPGEIRNASAEAHFDPLEDDSNYEIDLTGQVWIGASARITGSITGSIVLDLVVADVSGGLTVSATAMLNGEVLSKASFTYSKQRYEVKADFAASLALLIRLALEASVLAEAGIGPFKVSTEKRWTLAAKQFDTGLKLGIKVNKPLSYSSDKGLEVPDASDIEVTKPNFDVSNLLHNIFDSAHAQEQKS